MLCKNLLLKVSNYNIVFQSFFSSTIIIPLDKVLKFHIPEENEIKINPRPVFLHEESQSTAGIDCEYFYAGNLDDIRQFTTPEMFAELKMDLQDRGGAEQKTDVVSINAQVTEVDEDADRYLVSVRFTGVVRDDSAQQDESFDEVWHMMKPRQGNHGWVLSGIQQTQ